jgi:hypothetical protein
MYISIFTVAVPVKFTSEFRELFVTTSFIDVTRSVRNIQDVREQTLQHT